MNWLHAAPEDLVRTLDRRPSRVDFVSFANGARHVVEIDGPSHYGTYNEITHTYSPDEREYARNLRIERWLRSERWEVTRIGRAEVSEVMGEEEPFGKWDLAAILPFGDDYPEQIEAKLLGLPEIDRPISVPARVLVDDFPPSPADDDIPF